MRKNVTYLPTTNTISLSLLIRICLRVQNGNLKSDFWVFRFVVEFFLSLVPPGLTDVRFQELNNWKKGRGAPRSKDGVLIEFSGFSRDDSITFQCLPVTENPEIVIRNPSSLQEMSFWTLFQLEITIEFLLRCHHKPASIK